MRNGADGCHISFDQPELLEQAIATLKPQGIVGVGGLKNKHDAMSAGERDIDYVMFGEPSADGYVAPLTQRSERVQWWASIFNVPCVAYADHRNDIPPLCQAGADFIALGPVLWQGGDDALSTLRALHQLIEASAR
jgi:thiamine-phosphate pyrophosphorylase